MDAYPFGTRMLFAASRLSGLGVHELYQLRFVSFWVTVLDKLSGRPRI